MQVARFDTGASPDEEAAGQALVRPRTPASSVRAQRVTYHSVQNAFLGVTVVADQGLLGVDAEESCPVDSVIVAELTVVGDIHISSTDLSERLQLH